MYHRIMVIVQRKPVYLFQDKGIFNNLLDHRVQHVHLFIYSFIYFSQEDTIPVLKITQTAPLKLRSRSQWAEELDVSCPVRDFEKKVPVMAKTWKFELDTFQKMVSYK
jgi:hypothetical protein